MSTEPPVIKRRHVAAAVAGNALEFYDFTTYSTFAVAIGHAFFPAGAGGLLATDFGSLMLSLFAFGAGFLLRPVGGIVLGHYADKVGRRPAMLISFTMMGLAIFALALIPSYSSIGLAAPILAVAARLTQGFALGGEVGPTTAYLVESAPHHLRGLYASWQSGSQSIASMVGGAVGVILAQTLPPDMLDVYGWRIAFLLGAMTLPFGLYIRSSLPETLHAPDHLPHSDEPYSVLFARHWRPAVLAIFVLMGGTVATYVLNYMTTFARTTLHMGQTQSFSATLVNGFFGILASLAGGYLSDRYGRRVMMIGSRALFLALSYPVFLLIVQERSTLALLAGTATLSILLNVSSGAFYVAFIEVLPKRVRGGMFATIYALSITIFGGTTQPLIAWMIDATGNPMAPSWYLMFASLLALIAMYLMVESAPVVLSREPAVEEPGLPPTA